MSASDDDQAAPVGPGVVAVDGPGGDGAYLGRGLSWAALGRLLGAVVLFVLTLWAAALVSITGLLAGCNVTPEGESGPYVGVSAALCDSHRLTADVATYAVFLVPGALLLAAQIAYWKRRGGTAAVLTVATLVPGMLFVVASRLGG